MSFNFRVVESELSVGSYFEVHEVYYDSSGKIVGYVSDPLTISGDSVEELYWYLDKIKGALNKPVLKFEELLSSV